MKKFLLIFALLGAFALQGHAQNANRSGLFLELGGGAMVGTPPINKIEWVNNTLSVYKSTGADVNFAVGYRRATSRVFAWEVKAEISTNPAAFENTFVASLMPGIRYTTKELFSNISLYFGANIGVGLGSSQYREYGDWMYGGYNYTYGFIIDKDWEGTTCYGTDMVCARIGLTAGLNITPKFYAGLYWDYNLLFDDQLKSYTIESIEYGTNSWGALGVRLGFRF